MNTLSARARLGWALMALCGASACLPLAVFTASTDVPAWLWVFGSLAGLCSAVRLLLGAPLRRDDFVDETSVSRNAELRAELLI